MMANRLLSVVARSSRNYYSSVLQPVRQRCYSSIGSSSSDSNHGDITNISLSQRVPWIPTPQYKSVGQDIQETQVTRLQNGIRVASEPKFGQFCTVGVLIDSGSRYEVSFPSGITHFLEKLAFSSTSKYGSRDEILQKLEGHGGICDCQGSRDTLIYAVSANVTGLEEVVEILSEVVYRPLIKDEELEESRQVINFELESLDMNPNPEPLLMEIIHAAAYSDNTLGLPKICPTESIPLINQSHMLTYLHNFHSPERIVLAGVGVDHEQLIALGEKYFLRKTPIWEENSKLIDQTRGMDKSISQYTGGMIQTEKDLSNVSLGPTPMPELAHYVIGLESCSHRDDDFIAFCVLNMLMGGGGSFSAGGPGKGMYTRLYLNVLNRYHWIHNATAYNHAYMDSGLFCIHAAAHPSSIKDLVEVISRELVNTRNHLSPSELGRAKTQLQSMLLMNLESRPVIFEDVGRQVLANNNRLTAHHYYDEIEKITGEDIQRVACRMLSSKPSVAALGEVSKLPSYENIAKALRSKDGSLPKRSSLFSR